MFGHFFFVRSSLLVSFLSAFWLIIVSDPKTIATPANLSYESNIKLTLSSLAISFLAVAVFFVAFFVACFFGLCACFFGLCACFFTAFVFLLFFSSFGNGNYSR